MVRVSVEVLSGAVVGGQRWFSVSRDDRRCRIIFLVSRFKGLDGSGTGGGVLFFFLI